jgi:hypothetical protein
MPTTLTGQFKDLTDPRRDPGKRHHLLDIITIVRQAVKEN